MSGEVPPPMSGTCGCSLNGDMYIFGGCNDNGQTNQLYCVNLLDGKYSWRKVNHKSGSSPSPRDKRTCWVFNGSVVPLTPELPMQVQHFGTKDTYVEAE
ncbi:unnamed protein product [Oncorhynchus mykiss]|uniref:Uncharacterized protein n=1 Tax=Oncorhynchus mykiss TaxID=8022 RepID=A0A060XFE6_ONCMY|nr:unnamed protein product [Oncorhynchus mykiss]